MPRLSKTEIKKLKLELEEWQTPANFYDRVKSITDAIESVDFFNQAGLTFLREALLASQFGKARNASLLRLAKDRWPDFELKIDGVVEPFEVVEADDPLRRRGQEYKNNSAMVTSDPVENWIWRANQAQLWLKTACEKKVAKKYGAKVNLLIYLNMSEYGIRHQQVVDCFASATDIAGENFDCVWVLWNDHPYLVWKSGQTA